MPAFAFEASGALKKPSAEALREADDSTAVISLTSGTLADGRPFYAYVAVKPSRYEEFHRKTAAREAFVINQYGKIIIAGFEGEPPAEIVQHMRDEYGYDENFIEKLLVELSRQRTRFSEQYEEKRIMGIVAMLKKNQ